MWFEGRVAVKDLPAKLAELMQTVPNGQTEPMWELVSTNIGNTLQDDGYVLYSKGTSGKDNLYLGVKNAYIAGEASWAVGHQYFICENYIPGNAPGENGKIEGEVVSGHRYTYATDWNGVSLNTIILNYKISITKDRIILITNNGVTNVYPDYVANTMTYMGLMKRYSDEPDSSASVIASTTAYPTNTYAQVRALRDRQRVLGGAYTARYLSILQDTGNDGWGGLPLVTNVPLYTATEGFRGELDGVLVAKNYSNAEVHWRTVPETGPVRIGDKEYVAVYKKYYAHSRHNQFEEDTTAHIFLIEKK